MHVTFVFLVLMFLSISFVLFLTLSSKVITQNYFLDRRRLPPAQRRHLKLGILREETARSLCGVRGAKTLVNIMKRFDMLISCQINVHSKEEFGVCLVPCLMQRVTDRQLNPRDRRVPSLHFKFVPSTEVQFGSLQTNGFLPHGFFHRLISSCCRTNRWKHNPQKIFYDYMVFDAEDFRFSLHMTYNGITLSAFSFKKKDPNDLCQALTDIRKQIESLIANIAAQIFPNLTCVLYLVCTCTEAASTLGLDTEAK